MGQDSVVLLLFILWDVLQGFDNSFKLLERRLQIFPDRLSQDIWCGQVRRCPLAGGFQEMRLSSRD